jgi:hypothetical protein
MRSGILIITASYNDVQMRIFIKGAMKAKLERLSLLDQVAWMGWVARPRGLNGVGEEVKLVSLGYKTK